MIGYQGLLLLLLLGRLDRLNHRGADLLRSKVRVRARAAIKSSPAMRNVLRT